MRVVFARAGRPISATIPPGYSKAQTINGAQRPYFLVSDSMATWAAALTLHPERPQPVEYWPARKGYAPAIATMMVSATATGYTIKRGAPQREDRLPSHIESKIRRWRQKRREPQKRSFRKKKAQHAASRTANAFIKPTSLRRSMATLVIAAITQSVVSTSTKPT